MSWKTDSTWHTVVEVSATLVALVAGVVALLRYYSRRRAGFLLLGSGLLGTATLDFVHALVTSRWLANDLHSDISSISPWSAVLPRLFLSVLLWVSYIAWREESSGAARLGTVSDVQMYGLVGAITVASLAAFTLLPLPEGYYSGLPIHRPFELLPGAFFAVAAVGYLRSGRWRTRYLGHGRWRTRYFDHWLILSLLVAMSAQIFFIPFSSQLYDPLFNAAHVLKLIAYLLILIGLFGNVYATFRIVEEESTATVRANESLRQEITERRRVEASLEDLTRRNESILHSAAEGICGVDASGVIEFINVAGAEALGTTPDELSGHDFHEVAHDNGHARDDCPVMETLRTHKTVAVSDAVFVRVDGTTFPGESLIAPMQRVDGATGGVVIFRDISERKAIEEMKDQFVSLVSHELRTPLTSIRGALGLIESGALGDLNDRGKRMASIATQNTERLVRLINDILDIERMESGRVELTREPVNVVELLHQAVDELETMATDAGVALRLECHDAGMIVADRDRIVQTLTNLIGNAIKFSSAGSEVLVRASLDGEVVQFEVHDEGRGIPEEKLESVFGRFQQVDASDSRAKGGTGLGLAICKTIVEQHGGRIWVDSALGRGSTFYFAIPRGQAEPYVIAPAEGGATVLVCDDDDSVREVLAEILRRRGFGVVTTASGREAILTARERQPDVILLDLVMPDMDGWQVVDALSENDSTSKIPVVVLSVLHARDIDQQPARVVAARLTKPVDEEQLAHVLGTITSSPFGVAATSTV